MKKRQGGVALISVLLIMSLAVLMVGGLLRGHRLLLQGSGQHLNQVGLRQLVVAGETWGLSLLTDAVQAQHKTVDLTQAWATTPPGFASDDAQVQVLIEDLAGRLNLNALLTPGKIDPVTLSRWQRLQEQLGLGELHLPQVGELRELSQLRLLPGVDWQTLRQLEPWVAFLPPQAALNINTAPVQVLQTLDGVDAKLAQTLARQRRLTAWPSVQAFTRDPLLDGIGLSSHGLGVNSRWYRMTVQVSLGPRTLRAATDVELDPKTRRLSVRQRLILPSIDEIPR